jgi:hypothetical protein
LRCEKGKPIVRWGRTMRSPEIFGAKPRDPSYGWRVSRVATSEVKGQDLYEFNPKLSDPAPCCKGTSPMGNQRKGGVKGA